MKGGTLDLREYLLQWGRPFYGAERHFFSDTGSTENSFNGAALFTGRREGPIVWTCQRSGQLQWGRPFYGAESGKEKKNNSQRGRFNGAALFTGRRDTFLLCRARRCHKGFNGAALFTGRRDVRQGRNDQQKPCFNGAALFTGRRAFKWDEEELLFYAYREEDGELLLQWGRPFYGAESGTLSYQNIPIHVASMGPPFLRGGESTTSQRGMGSKKIFSTRFNGAALFTGRRDITLNLESGTSGASGKLQWGRPFYGAERHRRKSEKCVGRLYSFNGAALFTGRRVR